MDLLNIDLPSGPSNAPVPGLLEKNLAALARRSPNAAQHIARAATPADFEPAETPDGLLSVRLAGRTLASRRDPGTEAQRLADTVDLESHAIVCVLGFGAGHHVRLLSQRLGRLGLVVCYEPDAGLLRGVFERVDCAAWIDAGNLAIVTDPENRAEIVTALEGYEGLVSLGVKMLAHPPSEARLGPAAALFARRFTEVVDATRTLVSTTLIQSGRTLRNLVMNADRFAACAGVAELAGIARNRPAVVVSAGPSLQRNIDELARPGVRDRVVIVAAQTVLRPLLARGIRPHIVCALDWSDLSTRFYEGLSAADVEGVTLIADPKVNPAVLDAWPGALRMNSSEQLMALLGRSVAGDHGVLKPGATVAHLAYYVARHLGCDPVVLVGQDLGFTDGQYYADGAAIHDVWAAELGEFRTLEALEWERIARGKRTLRLATDVLGRPIFTDEQMASYLAQFERDFAADAARGLATIDATEGGVAKQHTTAARLAALIDRFLEELAPVSALIPASAAPSTEWVRDAVSERLSACADQARQIAALSRHTASLLRQMKQHQHNTARVDRILADVYQTRDRVQALDPAWGLTLFIDQGGALARIREDRRIELKAGASPLDRQRAQIERDAANVDRIADQAGWLADLMNQGTAAVLGTAPRITRDASRGAVRIDAAGVRTVNTVEAVLFVDPRAGGLGTRRGLGTTIALGMNTLQLTCQRLLGAPGLDAVRLVTDEPEAVRALLGPLGGNARIHVHAHTLDAFREHRGTVARARAFGMTTWRGGAFGLTAFDECFDAATLATILEQGGTDAALVLGSDWCAVDAALAARVIARHREDPDTLPFVFTQAAPGLAPALVSRQAARELADARRSGAGWRATLGGVLAYAPAAPAADRIAGGLCVGVDPGVRDACVRAIADSARRIDDLRSVLEPLGDRALTATASEIAAALARFAHDEPPCHLVLELCTGRLASGPWGERVRGSIEPVERPVLALREAHAMLRDFVSWREDAVLTLAGVGDPLAHPRWRDVTLCAEELGFASVHLRTELTGAAFDAAHLEDCGVHVLSVDTIARSAERARSLAQHERHPVMLERLAHLARAQADRARVGLLPNLWCVPRLTRCDEVYDEVADWYDAWSAAGLAPVLDPLPTRVRGARIQALTLPAPARALLARSTLRVRSDGTLADLPTTRVGPGGLPEAWKLLRRAQRAAAAAHTHTEAKRPFPTPAA